MIQLCARERGTREIIGQGTKYKFYLGRLIHGRLTDQDAPHGKPEEETANPAGEKDSGNQCQPLCNSTHVFGTTWNYYGIVFSTGNGLKKPDRPKNEVSRKHTAKIGTIRRPPA